MLNITVTVIQEKEVEEILIGTIRTITILTVIHIQIPIITKIIIMDITIQIHIITMDHLMGIVMDMGMDMGRSRFDVNDVESSKQTSDSY